MTVVEVGATGPVAVGARLYRWRGARSLGVVVKASYTLRQRSPMELLAPMDWKTKSNAAHAGDEPFPLGLCEVIVGPLPQPARAPGNEVALTITRGASIVLDVRRKAGDEGARDATVGFGPLPLSSPLRAPYAGAVDLAAFRGVRELPLEPKLDAVFFQAAPLEQRLEELRGGDTVALLGMSHLVKAMQTAIPLHKGHAVVQIGAASPRRLALRLDRLHVAPDAMVAELSFRGMVDVPSDTPIVRVLGGLETEARPFAPLPFDAVRMWTTDAIADGIPALDEVGPATQVLPSPDEERGLGGTLVIAPRADEQGPSTQLLPDVPGVQPRTVPLPAKDLSSTVMVAAEAPPSMPFVRKPRVPGASAANVAPPPGSPWAAPSETSIPRVPEDPGLLTQTLVGNVPAPPAPVPAPAIDEDVVELDIPPSVPIEPAAAAPVDEAMADTQAPEPRRRASADPWRKDPEEPAPQAAPPAARAAPKRPDLSGGLYKRFKK